VTDLKEAGFSAGFLGNQDYFALDFDLSLLLFKEGRSPSFLRPTILFQWAPKYFYGDRSGGHRVRAVRNSARFGLSVLRHRAAFTYSINARSRSRRVRPRCWR